MPNIGEWYTFSKRIYYLSAFLFTFTLSEVVIAQSQMAYLTQNVLHNYQEAMLYVHLHKSLSFMLSVVGAIVGDQYIGRFKILLIGVGLRVIGRLLLLISSTVSESICTIWLVTSYLTDLVSRMFVKPNIMAFWGDQFEMPTQRETSTNAYSMFYLITNIAAAFILLLSPMLINKNQCFGKFTCYPLAFGLSSILILLAFAIFLIGHRSYKIIKPYGQDKFVYLKATWNAGQNWYKVLLRNPGIWRVPINWLYYADASYDRQLLHNMTILCRLSVYVIPVACILAIEFLKFSHFWQQPVSYKIGSFELSSNQDLAMVPILWILFIALFDNYLYPSLRKMCIIHEYHKVTAGGIMIGFAFVSAAILETQLKDFYPKKVSRNEIGFRVFNGELCEIQCILHTPKETTFKVGPLSMGAISVMHQEDTLNLKYSIYSSEDQNCSNKMFNGNTSLKVQNIYSFFFNRHDDISSWYKNVETDSRRGYPLVRPLVSSASKNKFLYFYNSKDDVYKCQFTNRTIVQLLSADYKIYANEVLLLHERLDSGGVYIILINELDDNQFKSRVLVALTPYSVSFAWQIPQYIFLAMGGVLIALSFWKLLYMQAPLRDKSLVFAIYHAFGSPCYLIPVFVSYFEFFENHIYECLFYALIIVTLSQIFFAIGRSYNSNDLAEDVYDLENE